MLDSTGPQHKHIRVKNGLGKLIVALVASDRHPLFMDLIFDSKFKTVHEAIAGSLYFSLNNIYSFKLEEA